MNIRFVDVDRVFDAHRFCEPGRNLNDQYYSEDTWIWNLSWFNHYADAEYDVLTFDNGGQYLEERGVGRHQPPNPAVLYQTLSGRSRQAGWLFRTFHPKGAGHNAIKDAVIAAMRADGVPGVV